MPKTKQQLDSIKQSRKQRIIHCALTTFCEKGYEGTKVDDITKKAKCSHGLFYHYFPTKKKLFEEVMNAKKALLQEETKAKVDSEPCFRNKIKIITEQIFHDIKHDENASYYFYFFVTQCFHRKENSSTLPKNQDCKAKKPFFSYIVDFFQSGIDAGQITTNYSAVECAEMFVSIIQGASLGYAIAPKHIQNKMKLPNADFVADIFFKGADNE
ncbi:MAG: TetR/AcrR family transcriptional regulator [Clostridia bacterium]|nr:TetR/AcrR family transcriptional regulator [Clostridia bacterium]